MNFVEGTPILPAGTKFVIGPDINIVTPERKLKPQDRLAISEDGFWELAERKITEKQKERNLEAFAKSVAAQCVVLNQHLQTVRKQRPDIHLVTDMNGMLVFNADPATEQSGTSIPAISPV